jgi:hypothetical protein
MDSAPTVRSTNGNICALEFAGEIDAPDLPCLAATLDGAIRSGAKWLVVNR